ncbi:MAG TPA: ribonuclease HII [Bacteroidales bacterium]|nr:ribonuclease HII [Bacteroidales bacterium]
MKVDHHLLSYLYDDMIEAGCDEAGRGCLAGPVFAAAVILPHDFFHPLLNDSKQMTRKNRELLRPIIEKEAISWAVASVSNIEIDRINILNASIFAMHKALDALDTRPEFIIVDGNKFRNYNNIPHICFIKGDGRFTSVAAASVLAKTHRDEYMVSIASDYPQYGWEKNFAYPTAAHREAIMKYGPCEHHRTSFRLLK